jgi:S-adenosylmethionine uptake transporter
MTRAFSKGSTTSLASLQYSTVAFAAMYGIAIWGDSFSIASALGLALIVLSGIVAIRRGDRAITVEI